MATNDSGLKLKSAEPVPVVFSPVLSVSALVVLLLFSAVVLAQNTHTTVRHHKVAESDNGLSQAESLIEKKDFASAETLLQKITTAEPANYQAWFDLGFVYNALGNQDESIVAYRKSVDAKPDVFESNLNLGLMLTRAGKPDAAQYLRAATKLKPSSNVIEGQYRAWLSLGHALAKTKPADAVEAFHQAAILQPKDPEAHLSAGPLLEDMNRFADAIEQYQQALALDPKSSDALIGLANVYMRGHRFGEAEDALRKLIALQPGNIGAHLQLGRMLAADGRSDEAIAELETVQKTAPNDPALQRDLADLYLSAKKYAQAEPAYRALLTGNPRDPELHNSLGQVLLYEHKPDEAQREFLAAIQLKADFGQAYGNLAIAANENKNYPLTIKALDERAKYLPEGPPTYFLRASAYDHLRNVKMASENYHRFLDAANGKYPDQEWQARHRLIAIEKKP